MTSPMFDDDPLAPLLLRPGQGPGTPLRYRSGKVLAWNQTTGANSISIDGEVFTNVPISLGTYVGVVVEGDTVTLYSTTDERGISTYAVAGVLITPPDVRIARATLKLGYACERRECGELVPPGGTADSPATNFNAFPSFTRPARLIAASGDSVLECRVEGTMYGFGASSEWDMGVLIDGVSDYVIAGLRLSNGNGNAHTQYAGTICIPTGAAGTKTIAPRWRYNGGNPARVDAGDWFVLTVRETFIR